MFYEAVRIIKEMRDATSSRPTGPLPRVAVWENVPGALSANGGQDFGVVLDELAQLGAVAIEWRVLDAQHFGVPQRRRRVFVVAIFDPAVAERCSDPLLPVAEGRARDFASGRKKGQNATGRSTNSPDDSRGYRMLGFGHYADDDTASALKQRDYKDATDLAVVPFVKARRAQNDTDDETWVQGEVTPTLNAFDNGGESRATVLMPVVFDGTRHDDFRMDTEIVPTLKQRMGTGGGQVPMVAEPIVFEPGAIGRLDGERHSKDITHTLRANMGDNHPAVVQPVTVFQPGTMIRLGGGIWEETVLSPTLKATQAAPSVTTTYAVRRLTPLECERLMGWPDDHTRWTDDGREQADTNRYKQCGNGVATPVARWIAGHIKDIL